MNTDFRVGIAYSDNHKFLRMVKRLGAEGGLSLIELWRWTAQNKPDGVLSGLNAEAIEVVARWHSMWNGEPNTFFNTLVELRLLDYCDKTDTYAIHDWDEHQPWAKDATKREEEGRFNRLKSTDWGKSLAETLSTHGISRLSKKEYEHLRETRDADAFLSLMGVPSEVPTKVPTGGATGVPTAPAPAPAPIPAPAPDPDPKKTKRESGEREINSVFLSDTKCIKEIVDTQKLPPKAREDETLLDMFLRMYYQAKGTAHPAIELDSKRKELEDRLEKIAGCLGGKMKLQGVINTYFNKEQDCDYSIFHFAETKAWQTIAHNIGFIASDDVFNHNGKMKNVLEE